MNALNLDSAYNFSININIINNQKWKHKSISAIIYSFNLHINKYTFFSTHSCVTDSKNQALIDFHW